MFTFHPAQRAVLAAVVAALGLGAAAAMPAPASAAPIELDASLYGANVVPGPGDPEAGGLLELSIDPEAGTVCAHLFLADAAESTGAAIHRGAAGENGDLVVTLPTPTPDGVIDGCVEALDGATLQAIVDDRSSYYAIVTTMEFPDGAVRGQLGLPIAQLFGGMAGRFVVPGPGDPDAQGQVDLGIVVDAGEICMGAIATGAGVINSMHLHRGAAGEAGPELARLITPDDEATFGCVDGLDPAMLEAVINDPAGHYVMVRTAQYPDGAIRGQLSTEWQGWPGCDPGYLCTGPLQPATYTYLGFEAALAFTTTTPWNAQLLSGPVLSLDDPEGRGSVFGMPFSGTYADPCDPGSVTTADDSPEAIAEWLSSRPFLTADSPRPVEYGGASGFAVDLFEQTDACGSGSALLFPIAGGVLGYVSHSNGEAARVVILDAGGQTLLFFANAVPGGDQWSFIGLGQDLFETFRFAVTGGAEPTPSPTPGPSSPASPQPSVPGTESPSGPVLPDTAIGVVGGGAPRAGILALATVVGSAMWMVARRR